MQAIFSALGVDNDELPPEGLLWTYFVLVVGGLAALCVCCYYCRIRHAFRSRRVPLVKLEGVTMEGIGAVSAAAGDSSQPDSRKGSLKPSSQPELRKGSLTPRGQPPGSRKGSLVKLVDPSGARKGSLKPLDEMGGSKPGSRKGSLKLIEPGPGSLSRKGSLAALDSAAAEAKASRLVSHAL